MIERGQVRIMKKLWIIILVFLTALSAQQFNGRDYFKYAMPEIGKTWEGYVILGTGAALSGLALMADKPIKEFMTKKAYLPKWLDHAADMYVHHYWAFGVSALGALGYAVQTGNYGESFRYWAMANLGTIGVTYALKYGLGRLRPNDKDNKSYPSGHTSVAFATATMYQMWYGWKGGLPAYTFAAITAFQRLDDNQHWFSDVIMGAAIGIAIPYMFYKGEERAKLDQGLIVPPVSISIPFNFPVGK